MDAAKSRDRQGKGPDVTLSTYSYNDHEFVRGLFASVADWTRKPDSYQVVDDGSVVPLEADGLKTIIAGFAPDAEVRVIRLESNRGITEAKRTGLSSVRGRLIFSMDCDTRVSPDYLETCLRMLSGPGAGKTAMSSGGVTHNAGDDFVSRYLKHFGDIHNLDARGVVDFIPGNAFLLRRKAWQAVDGFGRYEETNCQDHVLCNRLRRAGYELVADGHALGWQTRRISRITLCRRVWKWCHAEVKKHLQPGIARPFVFEVLVKPMLARIDTAAGLGEPLFAYIELLYLAYTVSDLLQWARERNGVATGGGTDAEDFRAALDDLLATAPRLRAVLYRDLRELGTLVPGTGGQSGDGSRWDDYLPFADMFRQSGLLRWLDTDGVRLLLADERDEHDFSSYDKAVFSTPAHIGTREVG